MATLALEGVSRLYGDVLAVDDVTLSVGEPKLHCLLGPNGSGKTTTIHMLTTLVRPTAGRAWVGGREVATDAVGVRAGIGLVFQESALDRNLSVAENLHFAAALQGVSGKLAEERIAELLALFELEDRRDTAIGALSGGMRRAVDIARGVLHRPRVLFLDEPTIGLDPINRRAIWRYIDRLRADLGATVLLTTHYLEEADDCHRVLFLNRGRIIGDGAPSELIGALGHSVLEVTAEDPDAVAEALSGRLEAPVREGDRLLFRIRGEEPDLTALRGELGDAVHAMNLRKPDLNDVYVWLNRTDTPLAA